MKTIVATFLFLLHFLSYQLQAQAIIAEANDFSTGSTVLANHVDPMFGAQYQSAGQSFLSAATTNIGSIEFYIQRVTNPGTVNMEIYSCSSPNTLGTLLQIVTGIAVNSAGWISTDISALNISVTAGNYYAFILLPQSGLNSDIGMTTTDYPGGEAIVNGSFYWWDSPFKAISAVTLPIHLLSFTTQKQDKVILLEWKTAAEQNSKDFIVQYSIDGIQWKNVVAIPAAGESNTIRQYRYTHTTPIPGNNYYRIHLNDLDGTGYYSAVRTVSIQIHPPVWSLTNNVVGNGILHVKADQPVILSLVAMDGKLIWQKQVNPGFQYINVGSIRNGIYFLKGNGEIEKFILQ